MNFLAHLYLSKDNNHILIGNFIADAVKGKKHENYPKEIQVGILLHRQIDYFTDTHPIVRRSKRRLHERYDHYDGVIIDILYDHFLAKNWLYYSEIPLEIYAKNVYSFFQKNIGILPVEMQKLLPFMIQHNWLVSYASLEGIEKVLIGMNRRTKGISKMDLAIEDLIKYYDEFESDFLTFFIDLIQFSEEKTINLLSI
jgi:acyl carrier protein phosphodiesterase